MLKISILLFILVVSTSCDCLQCVQGVVIDAKTRLPIDKVVVKQDDRGWSIHTDSLGNFKFFSMSGGLFGCPKVSLSFEKEGYNKAENKYKSCSTDSVLIVLEKQVE